jgi:spore coat polysaccharide biosynthesis protein SpsF
LEAVKLSVALGRPCGEYVVGAAQLGMPYGVTNQVGPPSEAEARDMLALAVEAGATVIDTAAAYGDSEERLGRILSSDLELRSGTWVVTKLGLGSASAAMSAAVLAGQVRAQIEGSSRRLGIPRLPLVLLHDPSQRSAAAGVVWEALRDLVQNGRIEALGVSVYTAAEAECALEDPTVRAIQAPASVLDRRIIRASIPERCRSAGVSLFLRSVFLQGLLATPEPPPGHYPTALVPYVSRLHRAAERRGLTSRALALGYARSLGATGLVVGAETLEQVRQNVTLWREPELTAAERERLEREVPEAPEELVDPSRWTRPPLAAPEKPSEGSGGRL